MGNNLYSQNIEYKKTSIRTGIGLGINEGHWETGMGLLYSFGLQKSYGNKNRIRVNPNILFGGFMNYSRGLIGTGGKPEANHNNSDYFYRLYFGENISL